MPIAVTRDDVQRLVEAGAQVADVLQPAEYEAEHIASAVNLPLKALNRGTAATLDARRPVIVYCHDYQ